MFMSAYAHTAWNVEKVTNMDQVRLTSPAAALAPKLSRLRALTTEAEWAQLAAGGGTGTLARTLTCSLERIGRLSEVLPRAMRAKSRRTSANLGESRRTGAAARRGRRGAFPLCPAQAAAAAIPRAVWRHGRSTRRPWVDGGGGRPENG